MENELESIRKLEYYHLFCYLLRCMTTFMILVATVVVVNLKTIGFTYESTFYIFRFADIMTKKLRPHLL